MTVDDRYPLARATLQRLLRGAAAAPRAPLAAFQLGPAVLRAPAPRSRVGADDDIADDDIADDAVAADDADLLGELVDMVLVGADDSQSHLPEVHLQFKADVFGGLHLRLQKAPEGLIACFTVQDAAARRAVVGHLDALVARLRDRGFAVLRADIDVAAVDAR